MTTPAEQLLASARARGADLPYAGAVTPQQAHQLLQQQPSAKLVDVRTNAERHWVGQVALPPGQHVAIEWSSWPSGVANPQFVEQLNAVAAKDDVLLFLCRSGVRSRHAAKLATEHGFANAFDILEGFEGDKDSEGHRKNVAGWCKAGLPWIGG
ncbi:MAG: rhodanese-like domain-containing protein [Pseudomonadota bacterium]|nr:rhodanese-like domain-containing protein [Pseudomonadota bacterium]